MNTGLRYKYSETFYQTSFANQLKSLFQNILIRISFFKYWKSPADVKYQSQDHDDGRSKCKFHDG